MGRSLPAFIRKIRVIRGQNRFLPFVDGGTRRAGIVREIGVVQRCLSGGTLATHPIRHRSPPSQRPLSGAPTAFRNFLSPDHGLPERQSQRAGRHRPLALRPFADFRDTIAATPRHVRRDPRHVCDYPKTRPQTSETRLLLPRDPSADSQGTIAAPRAPYAATRYSHEITRATPAGGRDTHAGTRDTLPTTRGKLAAARDQHATS